jgi:hypothetical protein
VTATVNECVEAAQEYLPAEIVDQWVEHWTALLRRGYRLRPLDPGEAAAAVCRFGGNPRMPKDEAWPEWPGHGPLTFIAALARVRHEQDFLRTAPAVRRWLDPTPTNRPTPTMSVPPQRPKHQFWTLS